MIPAADLSEQISTAGTEASGTGNMKFALNGALTIGTMDGANIEMSEAIGKENMFIFGLTAKQVEKVKRDGYNPYTYYQNDKELKEVIDLISSGFFSPEEPHLFLPIVDLLLKFGDKYLVMADFRSYVECQNALEKVYQDDIDSWVKMSIKNVANMGFFSSDRTIDEYAKDIWHVQPVDVQLDNNKMKK